MPEPAKIDVSFSNMSSTLTGDVTVRGDSDELFLRAVARAVREQLDAHYSGQPAAIWWADPDYPEGLSMLVPEGTTMGAAREYFGEESDATPPTIHVNEGGIGGDSDTATYIIQLMQTGFAIAGYVSSTLAVQRAAVKVRYGRARQLAKDWNDGDHISPELREVVLAKWIWPRKQFDKVFGLDAYRGPLLLRTLGYERIDMEWGEEWHKKLDDEGNPEIS